MSHLLIIGLDGGTWDLLTPMLENNQLPFLSSLIKSGTKGVLQSETPPLTPAAWTSFHTGKKPGDHGVIDFFTWNRKTNQPEIFDSSEIGTTFWHTLQSKSLQTACLNVPMTYPPGNIPGYVVSGILTPDITSDWTSPYSLKKEILTKFPEYEPSSLLIPKARDVYIDPEAFITQMHRAINSRFELASWINKTKEVDVSMVQFQVIDWVQHVLWNYLEDQNSQYYQLITSKIYSFVDGCIKKLWEDWEKQHSDAQLLILSDHGFQKHLKRINLGNSFYEAKLLDQHAGVKNKLNKLLSKTPLSLENDSPFELVGRSGWGRVFVKPHINLSELLVTLKNHCDLLNDPDTGIKVIKRVWLREELYSGSKMDQLPEILIEPEQGYTITAAIDKSGSVFQDINPKNDFHSGIHHPDGIIISSQKTKLPKHISNVAQMILDQF